MAFLTPQQLQALGFASVGKNVKVSDKASIYGAPRISLGDETRIDDFCVVSAGAGGFTIGRNVHLAVYVSLIGAGPLIVEDFAGLSSRVAVYTSNDDYSGAFLTGPTVPAAFTNVTSARVRIGRHVIVGAGSVVLPGVDVGDGCSVGALSLVNRSCEPWGIYVGAPAKRVKERSRELLHVEARYLAASTS